MRVNDRAVPLFRAMNQMPRPKAGSHALVSIADIRHINHPHRIKTANAKWEFSGLCDKKSVYSSQNVVATKGQRQLANDNNLSELLFTVMKATKYGVYKGCVPSETFTVKACLTKKTTCINRILTFVFTIAFLRGHPPLQVGHVIVWECFQKANLANSYPIALISWWNKQKMTQWDTHFHKKPGIVQNSYTSIACSAVTPNKRLGQ